MTFLLGQSFSGCTVHDGRRGPRVLLTACAALAALAFSGPAGAQQAPAQQGGGSNYGYTAPPGVPATPSGQGGLGAIPPVGAQERIAAGVQQRALDGPSELLRAAADAVQRREWGRANELLERASTRSLNGGTGANNPTGAIGPAGTGPGGQLVATIGEAREAVVKADQSAALRHIQQAMTMTP